MKSFKDYLVESERKYDFRIKIASANIDEHAVDRLEQFLSKYDLIEMSNPKKTIIQENPLDFYELTNVDVTIIDILTRLPVSSYVLQQDIKALLSLPDRYVVVRSSDDPIENQTNRLADINAINQTAEKDGLQPASLLSTQSSSDENEMSVNGAKLYGNEYNFNLLKYLAAVTANRPTTTYNKEVNLNGEPVEMSGDPNSFNNDIKDAPRSIPYWEKNDVDSNMDLDNVTGKYDNLLDKINPTGKVFTDSKNNRILVKNNK